MILMDAQPVIPQFCPQCHLPVPPAAYFCPNCGKDLKEKPLSTSVGAQIWLYIFSAILPVIAYLAIGKWQGIRYARSDDHATRVIGFVAILIMLVSTLVTFWLTAVWIQDSLNSALNGTAGNVITNGLPNY